MMEASLHCENAFITLTYDDDHLPADKSLVPRHLQLFMKRLRKALNKPIRFFACGEYGDLNQRPHYHAIIFGHSFPDKEVMLCNPEFGQSLSSPLLWRSSILSTAWSLGFSIVGECTFDSAAYVARYCLKKITGPAAEAHYNGRVPEFVRMSNRPGIAADWYAKYGTDVYPADKCFARGVPCKPPRYFDKLFELQDPEAFAKLKAIRQALAVLKPVAENSPDRLDVREELAHYRLTQNTHRLL